MNRNILVISIVVILSLTSLNGFAECKTMNNLQFAKEILRIIDVKIPELQERLSNEELYEIYSNILIENQIDIFSDTPYTQLVKNKDLYKLFQVLKENNLLVKVKLCLRKEIVNTFYTPLGKCEEIYQLNIDDYLKTLPNNEELLCVDNIKNSLKQKIILSPLNSIPEHIITEENRASQI